MRKWLKDKLSIYSTKASESKIPFVSTFARAPYLFHFNRHSISRGVAVGLFVNFLPLPLQIVWAVLAAFFIRANMPIAIALTWINNPFTFVPINLFTYKFGTYLTGEETPDLNLPVWNWHIKDALAYFQESAIWIFGLGKSYLVGVLVISFGSALVGYVFVQIAWKISIILQVRKRKMIKKHPGPTHEKA